jgi:Tol biopolymer transport system component
MAYRAGLAVCLAIAFGTVFASSTMAAFGPIELVSKTPLEQSGVAGEAAISADGNFVAFCGEIGGHVGIFRLQVTTDTVAPVVTVPAVVGACGSSARLAWAPSISADGRYVSFTTKVSPVEMESEPEGSIVYVADMSTSPPTYELASTADGSTPMEGGSVAAGKVALSADGSRVAFLNQGNVYVRDLASRETILISARRDPLTGMTGEAVAGGGAYEPEEALTPAGAAISGDGSTVAWVGEDLPEQVPMLGDEEAKVRSLNVESAYHEPLWRRVPGPGNERPPTRRVVGGGDPLAPSCPATGTVQTPACQGPYPELAFTNRLEVNLQVRKVGTGWGVKVPQLDADGDTVAFVGNPEEQYDLFVVDMAPGLDRREAFHQVTRWTNPVPAEGPGVLPELLQGRNNFAKYLPFTGEIVECGISPEGTKVAFTTVRQRFSTAPFSLVTEVPSAISQLAELYQVDLESDQIERLTPGPGKVVSEGKSPLALPTGASSPSFGGAGGRLLAFSSDASNLVAGDANEANDVFLVESLPPAPLGTSTISPRPPQPTVPPVWRLSANAYSRPDGRVRIIARVPGKGTLKALASSQVGTRLKTRQVASGHRRAGAAQTLMIDLKLGHARRGLIHRPGGLVTRLGVAFTGPGGKPLHAQLQSRFQVHRKRAKQSRKGGG